MKDAIEYKLRYWMGKYLTDYITYSGAADFRYGELCDDLIKILQEVLVENIKKLTTEKQLHRRDYDYTRAINDVVKLIEEQ